MLTLEQMKKLLNDPSLTDSEILEIRDQLYSLAELIFEKWQQDRKPESCRLNRLTAKIWTVAQAVWRPVAETTAA
jgi:hypothetical protein